MTKHITKFNGSVTEFVRLHLDKTTNEILLKGARAGIYIDRARIHKIRSAEKQKTNGPSVQKPTSIEKARDRTVVPTDQEIDAFIRRVGDTGRIQRAIVRVVVDDLVGSIVAA